MVDKPGHWPRWPRVLDIVPTGWPYAKPIGDPASTKSPRERARRQVGAGLFDIGPAGLDIVTIQSAQGLTIQANGTITGVRRLRHGA